MRSLGIIALFLTGSAAAQTPGFWLVGTAPGTNRSFATALSQDGGIAAGYSLLSTASSPVYGFTWTREGGRYDFGSEPGMPAGSYVGGLSSDGGTLVGRMGGPRPDRAYRRVGHGPLQDLGSAGYQKSDARSVSGDGSAVAGVLRSTLGTVPISQAFRWTEQGGMQPLGWLPGGGLRSEAYDISRDGSTIVGWSDAANSNAFAWRQGAGMQALPSGGAGVSSRAFAVNADGSIIAGDAGSTAARWTSSGLQSLGTPAGWLASAVFALSDDGSILGGSANGGQAEVAVVWTPTSGPTLLIDYLAGFGISTPPGWRLQDLFAISGDGLTLAGSAASPSGVLQGFVATVPAPSSVSALLLSALFCMRRRERPALLLTSRPGPQKAIHSPQPR